MQLNSAPFLVRLTLDLNSGLPVGAQMLNSVFNSQHIGANLTVNNGTLSCDAVVFPQGDQNLDAVAFVSFFHPSEQQDWPDNHIQRYAVNKKPFLSLERALSLGVKDGDWISCELDNKTQAIIKVAPCKRKSKDSDTLLVRHDTKSSTFETVYQGGVVIFNYIYLKVL